MNITSKSDKCSSVIVDLNAVLKNDLSASALVIDKVQAITRRVWMFGMNPYHIQQDFGVNYWVCLLVLFAKTFPSFHLIRERFMEGKFLFPMYQIASSLTITDSMKPRSP